MASRGAERTRLGSGGSHEGFLRHRRFRWLKVALLVSLAAVIAYAATDVQPRHNGGSWLGYALGTNGARDRAEGGPPRHGDQGGRADSSRQRRQP